MLSYQHAFHAGNHADVIKHLCWLGVIQHLNKKAKPYSLIDTHAGSGLYPLDSAYASKNREYETGISQLASHQAGSPLLSAYVQACQSFWQHNQYPGSPAFSAIQARAGDHIQLMELHPGAFAELRQYLDPQHYTPAVHLHHRDGLEGLIAMSPPDPKRGAVLIDPPYERLQEYREVREALIKLYQRWNNAQTVLWYPLLSARAGDKSGASERLVSAVSELGKTCFRAELIIADKAQDTGMYGSGVCVINPAWQLDVELQNALQEVCSLLGSHSQFKLEWLKTEQD